MKKVLCYSCAAVCFFCNAIPGIASDSVKDCADALTFDTSLIKNNLSIQLSLLNTITRENYRVMKEKLSADIPDYFTGEFDQFQEVRDSFKHKYQLATNYNNDLNMYKYSLSGDSSKNYSACLAELHNDMIYVYLANNLVSDVISIGIGTNAKGSAKVDYKISSNTPLKDPKLAGGQLLSGGEVIVDFNKPKNQNFHITVNAKTVQTGQSLGATFDLPELKNVSYTLEFAEDRATSYCTGGGNGNQWNHSESSGEVHAPANWSYDPSSAYMADQGNIAGPNVLMAVHPEMGPVDQQGNYAVVRFKVVGCQGIPPDGYKNEGKNFQTWGVRRSTKVIVDKNQAEKINASLAASNKMIKYIDADILASGKRPLKP